jgi:hypothetical protein
LVNREVRHQAGQHVVDQRCVDGDTDGVKALGPDDPMRSGAVGLPDGIGDLRLPCRRPKPSEVQADDRCRCGVEDQAELVSKVADWQGILFEDY